MKTCNQKYTVLLLQYCCCNWTTQRSNVERKKYNESYTIFLPEILLPSLDPSQLTDFLRKLEMKYNMASIAKTYKISSVQKVYHHLPNVFQTETK